MVKVDKYFAEDNQIAILEARIRELETIIHNVRDKDEPYNHRGKGDLIAAIGRTQTQFEELEEVVKYWAWKTTSRAEIFEKIEQAPVKLRDKLLMMFIFASLTSPGNNDGPPDGFVRMLKGVFGK